MIDPEEPADWKLYTRVTRSIDEIQAEIKRIGYWSTEPLPEAAYRFQAAFAMDTMTFVRWLQFVFYPARVGYTCQAGYIPFAKHGWSTGHA